MRRIGLVLACLAGQAASGPLPRADTVFPEPRMEAVELGWLLFWDPVLSGNRNIACATCHHPRFGTSDGLSLGLGEGGAGIGPGRRADPSNPPERRIARNAPALFNLGTAEFTHMFHDGRVESDPAQPQGIRTPLGSETPPGFASVLAAQAMFPVLSADEMAGHGSENEIAQAVRLGMLTGPDGAWDRIAQRVAAIPDYRARFQAVIGPRRPGFSDIANAIADFIAFEWRADDSRFDWFLRGTDNLTDAERRGMALFYGKAGCDSCHAGQFQTDHRFHAVAMPQIGPGKAERFESHARDTGRMRVTGAAEDAFAFRTPSLRNVALTAPYGHAGAFATLATAVRHMADPVAGLAGYDPTQLVLPALNGVQDFQVMQTPAEVETIAEANELERVALNDAEFADLIAFLHALTDAKAARGRLGIPDAVPSGLPVDR